MTEPQSDGSKLLTLQQQHELKNLHRNLRGALMQLEVLMTTLDIPHKPFNTVHVL